MKIIFLGTGTSQGIPLIGSNHPVCLSKNSKDKRLRSSILIEKNNKIILIDCGPDFRYQMLKYQYNFLDAILLTHEHSDHTSGLDDLRPMNFNMVNKLNIYGLPRVLNEVQNRFYYFFSKKYPGSPNIQLVKLIPYQYSHIKKFDILPIGIWHGKIFILGFIIDKIVAYITDASSIPDRSLQKLKGIKILILNTLRIEPEHPSHFTLYQALKIINILKPNVTYLTHISHLLGFHSKVSNKLPKNIYLAYDGLTLKI